MCFPRCFVYSKFTADFPVIKASCTVGIEKKAVCLSGEPRWLCAHFDVAISLLLVICSSLCLNICVALGFIHSDLFLQTLTVYITSTFSFFPWRLTPYEWYNPHPCLKGRCNLLINQYSLGNSFWFPVGGFMQQGSTIAPRALSTRCVSGVWLVLAIFSSFQIYKCNAHSALLWPTFAATWIAFHLLSVLATTSRIVVVLRFLKCNHVFKNALTSPDYFFMMAVILKQNLRPELKCSEKTRGSNKCPLCLIPLRFH